MFLWNQPSLHVFCDDTSALCGRWFFVRVCLMIHSEIFSSKTKIVWESWCDNRCEGAEHSCLEWQACHEVCIFHLRLPFLLIVDARASSCRGCFVNQWKMKFLSFPACILFWNVLIADTCAWGHFNECVINVCIWLKQESHQEKPLCSHFKSESFALRLLNDERFWYDEKSGEIVNNKVKSGWHWALSGPCHWPGGVSRLQNHNHFVQISHWLMHRAWPSSVLGNVSTEGLKFRSGFCCQVFHFQPFCAESLPGKILGCLHSAVNPSSN